MRSFRAIFVLFSSAVFHLDLSFGLSCYNCDSDASGATCVSDPQDVFNGQSVCQEPNDDYCYTFRLEEGDDGAAVTVSRGCCRIQEHSSICPPGSDFQESESGGYTTLLTRCKGDLCNDGEGDEGKAENQNRQGALIVDGVPDDYDYFDKDGDDGGFGEV